MAFSFVMPPRRNAEPASVVDIFLRDVEQRLVRPFPGFWIEVFKDARGNAHRWIDPDGECLGVSCYAEGPSGKIIEFIDGGLVL